MTNIKSLFAVATLTNKPVNQDACDSFSDDSMGVAIMVADGLGSHQYSEVGSKKVVEYLKDYLSKENNVDTPPFSAIFEKVNDRLQEHIEIEYQNEQLSESSFGTTLLCSYKGLNAEDIICAYKGNGAIFHIRGNFFNFPEYKILPWAAVNYLNPHSIDENGKEAIYNYFGRNVPYKYPPSIIKIQTDKNCIGDIIMICTDGIYSYDQVRIGKDNEGNVWVSGEISMEIFYQHLKNFFKKENFTDESLKVMLENYLIELKNNKLMNDDCSIGVIITDRAIQYYKEYMDNKTKRATNI